MSKAPVLRKRPVKKVVTPRKQWSPDDLALFRKQWTECHLSIKEMADFWKIHFGSVGKKRTAMGLSKRPSNLGALARWKDNGPPQRKRTRSPVAAIRRPLVHPDFMCPVGLLERTGCAFPVDRAHGLHLFCNKILSEDRPYCAEHGLMMVRK